MARNQVNRDALAILDGGRRDSSNIINTACYNFLGDPEIPLYIPAEKVRLTSVFQGIVSGHSIVLYWLKLLSVLVKLQLEVCNKTPRRS